MRPPSPRRAASTLADRDQDGQPWHSVASGCRPCGAAVVGLPGTGNRASHVTDSSSGRCCCACKGCTSRPAVVCAAQGAGLRLAAARPRQGIPASPRQRRRGSTVPTRARAVMTSIDLAGRPRREPGATTIFLVGAARRAMPAVRGPAALSRASVRCGDADCTYRERARGRRRSARDADLPHGIDHDARVRAWLRERGGSLGSRRSPEVHVRAPLDQAISARHALGDGAEIAFLPPVTAASGSAWRSCPRAAIRLRRQAPELRELASPGRA